MGQRAWGRGQRAGDRLLKVEVRRRKAEKVLKAQSSKLNAEGRRWEGKRQSAEGGRVRR
jgi:hypothetical protein